MTLTLLEWCTLISTCAAVVAASYNVLGYHQPKVRPVDKHEGTARVDDSLPSANRRRMIVPIVSALVAWGAVLFGFYDQHFRQQSGPDLLRRDLKGGPIGWSKLFINNTMITTDDLLRIKNLSVFGGNISDEEIKIDDAYFLSGISGKRLNVKIGWGGAEYPLNIINPIPPGAFVFVISDNIGQQGGLSEPDFLKEWSIIYFVAEYNGKKQRIAFDRTAVNEAIPELLLPFPHVTPQRQ